MNEHDIEPRERDRTVADWYLSSIDDKDQRATRAFDGWLAIDAEHADAIARCDASMALTPKLADLPDVAWAFAEARRLARTPPAAAATPPAWYQRPGPAWAGAAIAAAAAVALAVMHWLPDPAPPADPTAQATSITFASIVVPPPIDQIRRLDDIAPVVRIANQMTVDGRSIVVLPFSGGDAAKADTDIAQALYLELVRQLAGIPGLYGIEPSTAAAWTGTEFSPEQIAFFLGVRGVVQGRVTAIADEVTVDVRLTDAARDGLVFNQAYERPAEDIAMIRNDITSGLLDALTGPEPSTY